MKKVTFYSDEDIWKEFSTKVLEEEGSQRKVSEKIQYLIKNYLLENFFESILNSFKIEIVSFISSKEVKANRPKVKISSAEVIRKGRNSR